ncbi:MAG: gas vesicle protein K [Chloroflexi bacterium]|nr:gas vesicle protein K [Chloroflexota bacterium]
MESFAREIDQVGRSLPQRINADPEGVERGLAKLVLTVIELIRRMLEHQALRRMEGGSLTDDEIERLGETFMKLEQRMEDLKQAFGLEGEDLNLNLGPLGDLM